jgi:signal peptidase II
MKLLSWIAMATLAADQASKWAVLRGLGLETLGQIDVFPPFLTFRMAWNRGVNFGLLAGQADLTRWLLVVVALAISGLVFVWAWRARGNLLLQAAAGLLIGGALGNVVDRLIHGAVADFLNMSCCGLNNPYAFNLADVAIFAGAVGLILAGERAKTP